MLKKNIIYKSVLLFLTIVLISLPFVKVPIFCSSRGIVVPIEMNTQLNSIVNGKVVECLLIKNNQSITKGDTLLIVETEQFDIQKSLYDKQTIDYDTQLNDINNLLNANYSKIQTDQYKKELLVMKEKIAQVETQLSLSEKEYKRIFILYEKGVVAKSEYDQYYHNYENLKKQISNIEQQQLLEWQTRKVDIENKLNNLNSESKKLSKQKENYVIIAPSSGRLVNFTGIQKGNFVYQGQIFGEISPENFLVAECLVSTKDIGFINLGQKVKFQIDTYNYNQWGVLEGEVIEIDNNLISKETGEGFFPVVCKIDKNFLQLKNGYCGFVKKGMTFTARFYLVERTIWQLLFDKIDDWFNPILK